MDLSKVIESIFLTEFKNVDPDCLLDLKKVFKFSGSILILKTNIDKSAYLASLKKEYQGNIELQKLDIVESVGDGMWKKNRK